MDYATMHNLASDLLGDASNLEMEDTSMPDEPWDPKLRPNELNEPGLWSESESGQDSEEDQDEESDEADETVHRLSTEVQAAAPFRRRKGKKPPKKGRKAAHTLPAFEIRGLLGQANQHYVSGSDEEAQKILEEVIRIDHNVAEAWQLLGEIHKARGSVDKCLTAWMTAAHLSRDATLWNEIARMSAEQDMIDQADYCLRQYSKARPDDANAIWDRAMLNKRHGRIAKAIDACRQLLRLIPHDMTVVKELCHFYQEERRIEDAIKLIEAASAHYMTGSQRETFNWSELYFMADLYARTAADGGRIELWRVLISRIKSVARWLRQRQFETWWNDRGDDAEWDDGDDRRKSDANYRGSEDPSAYELPLEIRTKLARARLALKDKVEAMRHFEFVQSANVEDKPELYLEAANALLEAEAWSEALQFYVKIWEIDDFNSPDLWLSMAKAYKADLDYEQAETCLDSVLLSDPRNTDAMVLLADLYEQTDREQDALEMINKIIQIQRQAADGTGTDEQMSMTEGIMSEITPAKKRTSRSNARSKTIRRASSRKHEDLVAYEARKTEETRTKFKALDLSRSGMQQGDKHAIQQWVAAAAELIDDFRNIRYFYPSEKKSTFQGIIRSRRPKDQDQDLASSERLQKIANRLEDSITAGESLQENVSQLEEFRGFPFSQWLEVFLQYAIILVRLTDFNEAFSVLELAYSANVFYQDHKSFIRIHLAKMLLSIRAKTEKIGSDESRWLMLNCLFRTDAVRLHCAVLGSGSTAAAIFRDSENKKFMLRLIRTMDTSLGGNPSTQTISMKDLHNKPESIVPSRHDPILLVLYGHMLASGRGFLASLQYYTRAYALAPEDPMLIFSIGLAYLHRAMQRQSDNRHMQIVQAFSFLLKYRGKRLAKKDASYTQEANYNIARALHQLGLSHLALMYYEKVLLEPKVNPEYDLSCSAAYNMQLIYVLAGNAKMAKQISERYLVL